VVQDEFFRLPGIIGRVRNLYIYGYAPLGAYPIFMPVEG
jgi:hypothetical protein